MAMNPMQRKIRNSFLFGFLIAVIVAAVIIGLLFMKIKGLKETMTAEIEKAKIATTTCYATTKDVRKDGLVEVVPVEVITTNVPPDAVTDLSIYTNEKTEELQMVALADLDQGTVLTKSLVEKSEDAGSYRTIEFNSIKMPSKLVAGEFIDVRIQFAGTEDNLDFVVLSKIKVQDCTASTLWLTLTDAELQLLEGAIIESYAIDGSRLYAVQYLDDAQPAITSTYVPSDVVKELIEANAIIESDKEIVARENGSVRNNINLLLGSQEDKESAIKDGIKAEVTAIQAAREALLGEEY